MVLSAADREALCALWRKLGNNVGIYATEALERCGEALAPSRITCLPDRRRNGSPTPHGALLLLKPQPHLG